MYKLKKIQLDHRLIFVEIEDITYVRLRKNLQPFFLAKECYAASTKLGALFYKKLTNNKDFKEIKKIFKSYGI